MADLKTTREPGFYWVKDWRGDLRVAEWRQDVWWTTGDECESDDDEVTCLSERIKEPADGQ